MNGDSRAWWSPITSGPTELRTIHHVVASDEAAAKMALESGVDVELPFSRHLSHAARSNPPGKSLLKTSVDRAVARLPADEVSNWAFSMILTSIPTPRKKITNKRGASKNSL